MRMNPIRRRNAFIGIWLIAGLTLVPPAAGQATQTSGPGQVDRPVTQPAQPAEGDQPTTQPTSQPDGKPVYDINTTKTFTGDWGGLRTDLEKFGFKFELSYQQQFQQNTRGGLRVKDGGRASGSYDMVMEFDLEKM